MALETLKNVEKINGFKVHHGTKENRNESKKDDEFIVVNHIYNSLHYNIQNGPIKAVGVNGCQVDTIIKTCKHIIWGLNEEFPSSYNTKALDGLQIALDALKARTEDREKRNVEGTSQI